MKFRNWVMLILAKCFYHRLGYCNYYEVYMKRLNGCGVCSVCNWKWKCTHWSFKK